MKSLKQTLCRTTTQKGDFCVPREIITVSRDMRFFKKRVLIPHSTASTELLFTHLPSPSCNNLLALPLAFLLGAKQQWAVWTLSPFTLVDTSFPLPQWKAGHGTASINHDGLAYHLAYCTRPNQKGNKGIGVIHQKDKKHRKKKATQFSFS